MKEEGANAWSSVLCVKRLPSLLLLSSLLKTTHALSSFVGWDGVGTCRFVVGLRCLRCGLVVEAAGVFFHK